MSKFFGNGVVLAEDVNGDSTYTTVGQVLRIQPPGQAWDLVSFLVLGETYDPMHVAPVQNAAQWEVALFQDNDDAVQTAINAKVGWDTATAWKITFPEPTLNEATFSAKIFETENEQIVPKEGIIKVYRFVNTTPITWA